MTHRFQPGDQVFWWKRITRALEFPYRAEVLAVGVKRIQIATNELANGSGRLIRHVAPEGLQSVGLYHAAARGQGPSITGPAASWGRFTRYLKVGEDLRAVRQVDVFKSGNMLSYDRSHWVDEFGMLADARINRNRKQGLWGRCQEIKAAEFERVWALARSTPIWPQQVAAARMSKCGAVPVWFTIKGWRPTARKPRRD
jgi:hypothetical protein